MSNLPEKPNAILNKEIDLLVDDTLRRNGIKPEYIKEKVNRSTVKAIKGIKGIS